MRRDAALDAGGMPLDVGALACREDGAVFGLVIGLIPAASLAGLYAAVRAAVALAAVAAEHLEQAASARGRLLLRAARARRRRRVVRVVRLILLHCRSRYSSFLSLLPHKAARQATLIRNALGEAGEEEESPLEIVVVELVEELLAALGVAAEEHVIARRAVHAAVAPSDLDATSVRVHADEDDHEKEIVRDVRGEG